MRTPLRSFSVFCAAMALLVSCAGGKSKPDAKPQDKPAETQAATEAPKPARPAFENPGGMWMPEQLKDHAQTLKDLGMEMDVAALGDPTSPVLGAVVFLGGCTGSFVSAQGLVVTNHHCAQGALQHNSTKEHNLIVDGYLARTGAEEKWAGPTARIFVTQAFKDVTAQFNEGLAAIADPQARYKAMEKKQKELVAACEKDRPGIRCSLARYDDGALYQLIEALEIRDVRLVYAPAAGIGNYGGEVDNWRWPRHTGDFSFIRAYVGKDGKPADHAADNVPFTPRHFLKPAAKPVAPGDLVFVAGYPGRTNRLKTAAEVKEAVEWFYPRRVATFEMYLKVMEDVFKADKDAAIKGNSLNRGVANYFTNTKGQLTGLTQGGLAAQKTAQEDALRAWAKEGERAAQYADVFETMDKLHAERMKTREQDAALWDALRFSRLLSAATTIVRMAEERPKADAERHPDYQERNWKRLEQGMAAMDAAYHRTLDKALLTATLKRVLTQPEADRTPLLALVLGKTKPSDDAIVKAVDALYAKTTLEDVKNRVTQLQTAKTADFKKSKDPMLVLAAALRPVIKAMEDREEAYLGATQLVRPRYVAALRAFSKDPIASDANATLRITYGTVRGYKPTPDAAEFTPFTVLDEVVKKHTGTEPFNAPKPLLDAVAAGKKGPYVDAALKDVPVDFLSDLHITGGNSGSPTLNARGEITGLVFDGNIESMASDWVFMPSITRSIHVDLRYMAWVMDAVDGADHLLTEMGITPAVQ